MVLKNSPKVNIYYNVISETLSKINADKKDIKFQLISDSCILSCETADEKFLQLLNAIQTIQKDCILESIFIRGAISIGTIHFDDERKIVYGSGLIKAYELESKEKYPRVIIDPAIIAFQERTKHELYLEFNKYENSDNQKRILRLIFEDYSEQDQPIIKISNGKIFTAFAERVFSDDPENVSIVLNNLKSSIYENEHAYEKLIWMRDYWIISLRNLPDPRFFWNSDTEQKHHMALLGLVGEFEAL